LRLLSKRFCTPIAILLLSQAACAIPPTAARRPVQRPVVETPELTPTIEPSLYSAQEALNDALSGELEYIGTGRWPGVERSRACAFRNRRVIVINDYCTLNETPAFRIDVYSPERGRVRIYAEAHGAVSARERRDYFTFMMESTPTPSSDAHIRGLTLAMGYEELRSYEQQSYEAFLPSCYGGEQNQQNVGGCLGSLGPLASEFAAENRAFLERANDDWYRLIRQLRALATRYGASQED
jgi:hypothetical protein